MNIKSSLVCRERVLTIGTLEGITQGSIIELGAKQFLVSKIDVGEDYTIEAVRREMNEGSESILVHSYKATISSLKEGMLTQTSIKHYDRGSGDFEVYSTALRKAHLNFKLEPW